MTSRNILFLVLLLTSAIAWAASDLSGRPAIFVPASPATIVERLPHGYAALEPTALGAGSPAPTLLQVEQLVETASRSGDARLAARAEALLARVPSGADAATPMRIRAFLAQHRHDFKGSLAILDSMVARWPRDGDARLSRAQVQLVQGHLDQARGDCVVLALGIDSGRALLCIAALSLRQGNQPHAAEAADKWLQQSPANDPSRRFVLVMRGEIASRANDPVAEKWFAEALALAPDDVRTLAAYARHLRGQGRADQVWRLLEGAPATDSLQLERVLAARQLGRPDAAALAAGMARRYALAHELGSRPEVREEAEFMLTVQGRPDQALALALDNFSQQRDAEDVDLLVRAATASGQPESLDAARAWAAEQRLTLPATPAPAQSP
ncbi:MAG: hypothetical protein ABIP44_05545 [Pseudoxanthomonas sp.]